MIMGARTPLGKFINTSWRNMNLRAGKYRHLGTVAKNKCYKNVFIEFSFNEFKAWCKVHEDTIFNLKRPSIDRVNKDKNYTVDNIQIIELRLNIGKDKTVFKDGYGRCWTCRLYKPELEFCKDRRRPNGRTSLCKVCDKRRKQLNKETANNGSY